jgi:hypothetical protein
VEQERFLPALSLPQAIARRDAMVAFVQEIMVEGVDFGTIPGTPKSTLYKPGAERLCSFFGLTPDFDLVKDVEQWDSEEPLFYYRYKCRLLRDGRVVGDGEGSCNSREGKYRWRQQDRTCPSCGKTTIIKGKEEYGGGWLCFAKKGGCGAKYAAGDQEIEGQPVGRIPNPDIFDQINTLQKMAQKRAFIAATLIAVNASEFFTQDVEDMQPIGPAQQDTALLDKLRGELSAARDRLRLMGEEPRPLSRQQATAMDTRALADEITATSNAVWAIVASKLAEKAPGQPQDDQSEEWDAIDQAAEERRQRMAANRS